MEVRLLLALVVAGGVNVCMLVLAAAATALVRLV